MLTGIDAFSYLMIAVGFATLLSLLVGARRKP